MKANHNTHLLSSCNFFGAFNISKIQDESKSQPNGNSFDEISGAFNISKIQDESKSQPPLNVVADKLGCFQYFKDTR